MKALVQKMVCTPDSFVYAMGLVVANKCKPTFILSCISISILDKVMFEFHLDHVHHYPQMQDICNLVVGITKYTSWKDDEEYAKQEFESQILWWLQTVVEQDVDI